MKQTRRSTTKKNWLLATAAAMALCGIGATTVLAQHRVGSDGRALDANNRLGSGGYNQPAQGAQSPYLNPNQIVYGNVTGGREFRGFIPYTDPFAFRGTTTGANLDQFVRQSSGVTTGGASNFNAQVVQPFYGESRAVAPPPGFAQQSPAGGYVPAPALTRQPGDFRMGDVSAQGATIPSVTLPQPGQLVLPGPVDPSTQNPTVITASPLYGVRQWDTARENDMMFLNGLNETGRYRLDASSIERMRRELVESATGEDITQDGQEERGVRDATRMQNSPLNPFETPDNRPLDSGLQNQPLDSGQSLNSSVFVNPAEAQQRALARGQQPQRLLVPAAQQSAQYAELQRRLERYQRSFPGMEEQLAAREQAAEAQRARQQREGAGAPTGTDLNRDPTAGGTGPGGVRPGGPAMPGAPGLPGAPTNQQQQQALPPGVPGLPGARDDRTAQQQQQPLPPLPPSMRDLPPQDRPLVVTSLATGVNAKSLKDFLENAERLMKEGKFSSAMDQYDSAEMIAPNNPLIPLGRANAELGATYYVRADKHLREAFMKDPALLMAQYDLRAFIGPDRLEYIVRDLKEIASQDKNEARPVFLLAYIMYNTGNERLAASWLDLAEKRAGAKDEFYALLRKHWALPAGGGEDANK